MLNETREEEERFEKIIEAANATAKTLAGLAAEDALYALSIVVANVLGEVIPPEDWLRAMAAFQSSVSASLDHECDCDADHGTEH